MTVLGAILLSAGLSDDDGALSGVLGASAPALPQ